MSGQNYIGSEISLISLSDIRYVGILLNINPLESTVALQNVRSFGTEGRKQDPREEIPAADNTFDYVVFRGADIKDLQVIEAPPSFQSEQQIQAAGNIGAASTFPQSSEPTAPMPPSSTYVSSSSSLNSNYSAPMYNSNNANYSNYMYNSNTPAGAIPTTMNSSNAFRPATNTTTTTAATYPYPPYQQQPRYPMPVPENYQVMPSAPPASVLLELSPKKECTNEEKTVVSPDVQVAPIYFSTPLIQKQSQEKEEVATMEQVDEALVNSLIKQVADLDIKQPFFAKQKASGNKQQKNKSNTGGAQATGTRASKHAGNKQSNIKNGQTQKGGNVKALEANNGGSNKIYPASTGTATDTVSKALTATAVSTTATASTALMTTTAIASVATITTATKSVTNVGSRSNRRNSSNANRRNSNGIVIPKSDFDFASANAKFNRKRLAVQKEEGNNELDESIIIPEYDSFYDKKKSFFDDISCESKEYKRGNRNPSYKEESKLNLETFGQANPTGQDGKRNRRRGTRGKRSNHARGNKSGKSEGKDETHRQPHMKSSQKGSEITA